MKSRPMITLLFLLLMLLGNCSEEPGNLGSTGGGEPQISLERIPVAGDTLYRHEQPLVNSSRLWLGRLHGYGVNCVTVLEFFDSLFTAPWFGTDTVELDSLHLLLERAPSSLGNYLQNHPEASLAGKVTRVDPGCEMSELVWSDLLDTEGELVGEALDSLEFFLTPGDTVSLAVNLPREWFLSDTAVTMENLHTYLLLELDIPREDTTNGYLCSWYSRTNDLSLWPHLEFYYSPPGVTAGDTLRENVYFDTYLLQDRAQPGEDDLLVSVGDAWQFALRFRDLDLHYVNGAPDPEAPEHDLVEETVVSAFVRLYPKLPPAETLLSFGEPPQVLAFDVTTWDSTGTLTADTTDAVVSFTPQAAGGDLQVDVDLTRLVSRWLVNGDYEGVLLRASQLAGNLDPVRLVFFGASAADSSRRPELWIYRSESPF